MEAKTIENYWYFRYCGTTLPPSATTFSNAMTIIFKSDSSVSHEGFSAAYRMFDSREGKRIASLKILWFEIPVWDTIWIRWNIIFLLQYIAVCGGNYHTSTGVIHSPGWPENYAHGLDCSWVIHAPINQQIELNFTKFSLENHTNCDYDFLEV